MSTKTSDRSLALKSQTLMSLALLTADEEDSEVDIGRQRWGGRIGG